MASKRTPPEAETTAWHVIMGSARGAAHHAAGLPNEDSSAQQVIGDPPAGVVVAVADGHGHERHFRSAAGSALAVDVACQVASRLAADLGARTREDEVDGAVRDDLVRGIVLHWRAAVGKHIAMRPYTAEEQSALDLAGDGPEIPYGATLLLAMVAGRWLVCAQIGDGDLLAIRPDGRSFHPVAGDSRLDGQRTTSLCQPDAVASFRTSAHNLREMPLLALLVATDGYGNAQSADRWQPGVGRDLARLAAEHDRRWFEWQVPSWAERCASADGSGDDTTIALLLQPGAALPADRLVRRRSRRVPAGRQTVPGPPDPAGVVTAVPTAPAAETPGPAGPVPPRAAGAGPADGARQAGGRPAAGHYCRRYRGRYRGRGAGHHGGRTAPAAVGGDFQPVRDGEQRTDRPQDRQPGAAAFPRRQRAWPGREEREVTGNIRRPDTRKRRDRRRSAEGALMRWTG